MKKPRTLLLLGLVTFTALFFVLNRDSGASTGPQNNDNTAQQRPLPPKPRPIPPQKTPAPSQESIDLDALVREVPALVPRRPNAYGHVIISSADTSDEEATDALLRSFARGEAHLNHMRRENAFVTRRQIVELPETYTELGDRINSGEEIKNIIIPDFDGGTFNVEYKPNLMGPAGKGQGSLLGRIPGEEASDVILGYYKDSTSGYVNIPTQGRVLEYMTVGGNQIVVKEIDLEARNIAEPCGLCQQANGHSDHPAGKAHHIATGFGRETQQQK